MRAATSPTILGLLEPLLGRAARRRMTIFRPCQFLASQRVVILRAKFLPTPPTPRATTPHTHVEIPTEIQATRKNVVARRVFQTPAGTPRTLFCVLRAGFAGHYNTYMENRGLSIHALSDIFDLSFSVRIEQVSTSNPPFA